jgi:hypothetical protein
MLLMVGNAEFLFDDLGHTGARPDLAAKPTRFRSMPGEVGDETHLILLELGGRAKARLRQKRRRSIAERLSKPLANRCLCNAKSSCDLPLLPAELAQLPRSHPAPLSEVQPVGSIQVHAALYYRRKNLSYLRDAQ